MQRIMYPLHRLTRAVLPQMLERKRGKIVVVGSATSLRGRKGGVAVYGAARGAQHGYMKNVAMEVAPYVNINATAQTYVDNITYWPMEYRETAEFRERMAENPAARLATGRECAQTVLFLAGPESDFFYGQIIPFAGAGRCKNRGRSHPTRVLGTAAVGGLPRFGEPRWTSAIGTKHNCRSAQVFPELEVDRLQHQPAGVSRPCRVARRNFTSGRSQNRA
jgi:NAD(P)-dependent dehydrogenase (short-subunit alcohol dehydrogenase family)